MRYYFDTRVDDDFASDDTGLEIRSLNEACVEAALTVAEIAKEVIPSGQVRNLTVEVRDSAGPVLRASLRFKVQQADTMRTAKGAATRRPCT